MTQKATWMKETEEATRREAWKLQGPLRLVKVVNAGDIRTEVRGYITTGSSLLGKTGTEIRKSLGLNTGDADKPLRIYKLRRFPFLSEYEYDLTAKYPDGLGFNPQTEEAEKYPEGSDNIHQWYLKKGVAVPVLPDYLDLKLTERFPYEWLMK